MSFDPAHLSPIDASLYAPADDPGHAPRILLMYGSIRAKSYSRRAAEFGAEVLQHLGADVRFFDPTGLPQPDSGEIDHPKVTELLEAVTWCEGMVWSSPERHGSMTGIMKSQIDWIPLSLGAVRPTQGKTLAVMQVEGGSQSFNAVNQLRILGRWMRLVTIPNQSSIAKAWDAFEGDDGPIKASSFADRIVDVMEELVKFTYMTRSRPHLTDRYSERVESAAKLATRVGGFKDLDQSK